MTLADRVELRESAGVIEGETERLGTAVISLALEPSGKEIAVPETFPRLFWKVLPQAAGGKLSSTRWS